MREVLGHFAVGPLLLRLPVILTLAESKFKEVGRRLCGRHVEGGDGGWVCGWGYTGVVLSACSPAMSLASCSCPPA